RLHQLRRTHCSVRARKIRIFFGATTSPASNALIFGRPPRPKMSVLCLVLSPCSSLCTEAKMERDAFARLVEGHQQQICGLALSIVRDAALAEDVAQEAFVKAWRALPTLRDDRAFVPWLRKTTRRLALDAWRSRRRRGEVGAVVEAAAEDADAVEQ